MESTTPITEEAMDIDIQIRENANNSVEMAKIAEVEMATEKPDDAKSFVEEMESEEANMADEEATEETEHAKETLAVKNPSEPKESDEADMADEESTETNQIAKEIPAVKNSSDTKGSEDADMIDENPTDEVDPAKGSSAITNPSEPNESGETNMTDEKPNEETEDAPEQNPSDPTESNDAVVANVEPTKTFLIEQAIARIKKEWVDENGMSNMPRTTVRCEALWDDILRRLLVVSHRINLKNRNLLSVALLDIVHVLEAIFDKILDLRTECVNLQAQDVRRHPHHNLAAEKTRWCEHLIHILDVSAPITARIVPTRD
ncbi:unnamed protein product [Caenorhabditis bovis]|uniref:Uncharacterized protein n=1 Tax=Caenorhabditis bovis TaxID=2654633 RepID=A0A8S1FCT6_9PELO|nr:unnamed protein product [Caenorhabditis bovis]